jgi:hypothetical protein
MKLSIELPDIKTLSEVNENYLKEGLIAILYHIGRLSEKEACLILNKSRREFEEMLPNFGTPILSDTKDNINIELNA